MKKIFAFLVVFLSSIFGSVLVRAESGKFQCIGTDNSTSNLNQAFRKDIDFSDKQYAFPDGGSEASAKIMELKGYRFTLDTSVDAKHIGVELSLVRKLKNGTTIKLIGVSGNDSVDIQSYIGYKPVYITCDRVLE